MDVTPYYQDRHVTIYHGDARHLPLPDGSVDLVCTSPPFWALRSYTDGGEHYAGQIGAEPTPGEYVDNLIACTREWMRVLKPSGSIWINLGDKYAGSPSGPRTTGPAEGRGFSTATLTRAPRAEHGVSQKSLIGLPWRYALRCIDELGLILRAEVIWAKPNGLPESVTDRVRRSHEQWFHMTLRPTYYSAVDEIREPHHPESIRHERQARENGRSPIQRAKGSIPGRDGTDTHNLRPLNALGKLPGSVWTIATEPLSVPDHLGIDHFAAFPTEWPRRIILGWSPDGGTVLDPFGGTGTTALVARVLGRSGISVDMSVDYCRLAKWRTTDPGELARAMRVDKPEPVAAGQMSLLDEIGPGPWT